jgi:hypothetical protein
MEGGCSTALVETMDDSDLASDPTRSKASSRFN